MIDGLPRFSVAYYSFDINVEVLRDLGMPAACLRRDVFILDAGRGEG
jgi:hypothetical protein